MTTSSKPALGPAVPLAADKKPPTREELVQAIQQRLDALQAAGKQVAQQAATAAFEP